MTHEITNVGGVVYGRGLPAGLGRSRGCEAWEGAVEVSKLDAAPGGQGETFFVALRVADFETLASLQLSRAQALRLVSALAAVLAE